MRWNTTLIPLLIYTKLPTAAFNLLLSYTVPNFLLTSFKSRVSIVKSLEFCITIACFPSLNKFSSL